MNDKWNETMAPCPGCGGKLIELKVAPYKIGRFWSKRIAWGGYCECKTCRYENSHIHGLSSKLEAINEVSDHWYNINRLDSKIQYR